MIALVLVFFVVIVLLVIAICSIFCRDEKNTAEKGVATGSIDEPKDTTESKYAKKPVADFVKLPDPKYRNHDGDSAYGCDFDIIYHVKTRVMYMVSNGCYTHGVVTPLLNPDGTPMLYEPDNEEI